LLTAAVGTGQFGVIIAAPNELLELLTTLLTTVFIDGHESLTSCEVQFFDGAPGHPREPVFHCPVRSLYRRRDIPPGGTYLIITRRGVACQVLRASTQGDGSIGYAWGATFASERRDSSGGRHR